MINFIKKLFKREKRVLFQRPITNKEQQKLDEVHGTLQIMTYALMRYCEKIQKDSKRNPNAYEKKAFRAGWLLALDTMKDAK